jgi:DNA-binding winged helix-turn-helix (wHTH) protein
VVTYREVADAMGQTDPEIRNNTLARHLSGLWRELRDDPDRPRYIETVSRIGYRFLARGLRVRTFEPSSPKKPCLASLVTRRRTGELEWAP